jgi:proton-dependent oligopeptide transporter, POT family
MTYSEKVWSLILPPQPHIPLPWFQYVGFWLAYTLPTALFLLCPFVLLYGQNKYARTPPTGSVLSRAIHAWSFAARGRWSWNPAKCYKQFKAPGFWDAVKPSKLTPNLRPPWMTFDDVWVDELRRGLAACKVFIWFPIYCPSSSSFPYVQSRNPLHPVLLRVDI